MLMTCLILLLNLGISWWNAKVCGQAWLEANALGGFGKILVWCGAIQSAVGFSMFFIFVEAFIASSYGYPKIANVMMSLWYVAIIIPALGSGIVIMVHSWIQAYRERDFASIGGAAYNTIAMGHNIYSASSGLPAAIKTITEFFSNDEDDDAGLHVWAIVGAIIALGGGVLATYALINHYKGTLPLTQETETA